MEALGLNLQEFIYQLANFILLFAVLTYLLHKPLLKLIDSRKSEIKESLEAAEKMKREIQQSEARQKEMLEKSRLESASVLQEAREQAKALSAQIEKESQEKSADLLRRAEKEISEEKSRMKSELREELAALVVTASGKVLEEKLGEKEASTAKKALEKL